MNRLQRLVVNKQLCTYMYVGLGRGRRGRERYEGRMREGGREREKPGGRGSEREGRTKRKREHICLHDSVH